MIYASGFSEVATDEGRAAQDRIARRAAEAEIDPAGKQRIERSELLGDQERRMVG